MFNYHMPTKVFFGPLDAYANEFNGYGNKALIVTGKSSAHNGSLKDVLTILDGLHIDAAVFDRTEENPSVENVLDAAAVGHAHKADFVIGIGGGSPLDAAKAAALLLSDPLATLDALYDPHAFPKGAKPILAIPTTAGTGSEVTPFSVLTRHSHHTKMTVTHTLFPVKAFLNPAYTATMPDKLALHTAADALSHLIEGYLSSRANLLSDRLAEGGLAMFGELARNLTERRFDTSTREQLLNVSALAGMVIAQAKTTLPHQLGYALTYHKNIPHGAACAFLLAGYLRFHEDKKKTGRCLSLLGLSDENALHHWLCGLIDMDIQLSEDEIQPYVQALMDNPERLKTHPYPVTANDITTLYRATTNPPRLA